MAAIHRLFAVYLLLAGLAVGAYFVIFPIYGGQSSFEQAHDVWSVLNWFMAIASILLVLVTYAAKSALDESAATWDRLVVNGRFYLAVALLLGFLANWLADGWGGEVGPVPFQWVVVNIGLTILAVEMALTLWREPHAPFGARD